MSTLSNKPWNMWSEVCSPIQGIRLWLSVAPSIRLSGAKIHLHAPVMFLSHGESQMVVLQCQQWSIRFDVCCLSCFGLKGWVSNYSIIAFNKRCKYSPSRFKIKSLVHGVHRFPPTNAEKKCPFNGTSGLVVLFKDCTRLPRLEVGSRWGIMSNSDSYWFVGTPACRALTAKTSLPGEPHYRQVVKQTNLHNRCELKKTKQEIVG